jgi:hypothetical protein
MKCDRVLRCTKSENYGHYNYCGATGHDYYNYNDYSCATSTLSSAASHRGCLLPTASSSAVPATATTRGASSTTARDAVSSAVPSSTAQCRWSCSASSAVLSADDATTAIPSSTVPRAAYAVQLPWWQCASARRLCRVLAATSSKWCFPASQITLVIRDI